MGLDRQPSKQALAARSIAGKAKGKAKGRAQSKPEVQRGSSKNDVAAGSPKGQKGNGELTRAPSFSAVKSVTVNRAPVLTLWMSVCLERLGYEREAALSAAKVIAALCAISKGRSLGRIPKTAAPGDDLRPGEEVAAVRKRPAAAAAVEHEARVGGMKIKMTETPEGLRALDATGLPVKAAQVEAYLRSAFKGDLGAVRAAMEQAANSFPKEALRTQAMSLYERFRPAWGGWGVRGELKLADIHAVTSGANDVRRALLSASGA